MQHQHLTPDWRTSHDLSNPRSTEKNKQTNQIDAKWMLSACSMIKLQKCTLKCTVHHKSKNPILKRRPLSDNFGRPYSVMTNKNSKTFYSLLSHRTKKQQLKKQCRVMIRQQSTLELLNSNFLFD